MVMDVLILVLCGYMVYNNVTLLLEQPFAEWQLSQYALALVSLGLLAVAALVAVRAYKRWKKQQEEGTTEEKSVFYDTSDDEDETGFENDDADEENDEAEDSEHDDSEKKEDKDQ